MLAYLRKTYPSQNWRAIRSGFGWDYTNDQEDRAYWVSALASSYDGDDNTFQSQFYIYPKVGRPECLYHGRTYRG